MKHIVKFLYGQIQKNIICYESIIPKVEIAVFLAFLAVTAYKEIDDSKQGKIWGFNTVDHHYVKE